MAVAEELQILVDAKVNGAVRDLKRVQQQTGKTETSAKNMAKAFLKQAGVAAAAALSIRAVVKTLKESVQLYGQQIQAEQKLAAAIEATGGQSDILLDTYKDMASSIQGVTTVGDETTLMLMQQARIMGVSNGQMEEAVKGAIGLSKAFGIGTQQAIRGVANAMQGEYTTLQRYIPALRAANSDAEKMEIVQKAMADGFEVAKSEAEGGFGALEQYKNATGDLKEQIGALVVEGAEPFLRVLKGFAERMTESIKKTREFKAVLEKLDEGEDIATNERLVLLNKTLEDLQREYNNLIKLQAASANQARGLPTERYEKKLELVRQEIIATEMLIGRLGVANEIRKTEAETAEREATERIEQRKEDLKLLAKMNAEAEKAIGKNPFESWDPPDMSDLKSSLDTIREQADAYERLYGNINQLTSEAREGIEDVTEATMTAMDKFKALHSAASSVFSSLSSLISNYYQGQIDAAEGNTEKQKQLMREQAIAARNVALFEATVNTAAAIVESLPNIPLAIATGVAGAVQIAAIASTPIPALAEGGIVDKPTIAMIGEAGPEAVVPLGKGGIGGNVTIIVQGSMVRERDVARMITAGQSRLMGAY